VNYYYRIGPEHKTLEKEWTHILARKKVFFIKPQKNVIPHSIVAKMYGRVVRSAEKIADI
jgi:hypothetical protein